MRNAHSERSHDRGSCGASKALISLTLNGYDGHLALEHELLALIPESDAAENQYEPRRDRDTKA
jgi:hypothetical protein